MARLQGQCPSPAEPSQQPPLALALLGQEARPDTKRCSQEPQQTQTQGCDQGLEELESLGVTSLGEGTGGFSPGGLLSAGHVPI